MTDCKLKKDTDLRVKVTNVILCHSSVTASTLLNHYINWPGLAQVYQYRSQRENTKTNQITYQTQYGITSLSAEVASAEDLLKLRRQHLTAN